MKKEQRIKIAVQKCGRLNKGSMDFLSSLGLSFAPNERLLVQPCKNFNVDVLYLRDDDIPEYVYRGVADFGIIGQDVLGEKDMALPVLSKLGFGKCNLVIAAPKRSFIRKPDDLQGERIATSYPRLLAKYLAGQKIEAAVIPVSGSVEAATSLNLADAICDIVQSGATLEANNLKPLFRIFESQAVLIESPIKKIAKLKFIAKLNLN